MTTADASWLREGAPDAAVHMLTTPIWLNGIAGGHSSGGGSGGLGVGRRQGMEGMMSNDGGYCRVDRLVLDGELFEVLREVMR